MTHDHLPNIFDSYSDQGNGPAVVLLHALLLDHSMFSHQSESLSKQGFRVIAQSYAGHGRSNRLHGEPSVEAMSDQVFTLLDQLQITEPVILGGLSMGGYVAFAAWKKFQDRIRGLILMNTRAVPDTTEEAANRLRACTLIRQAKSISPLAATMLPRILGKTTVGYQPHVWQKVARILDLTDVEAACDALLALSTRPDRRPMLESIDVPTLVLAGEEDVISTPGEMEQIAFGIRGAEFVTIPKVGHLTTLESPDQVSLALSKFLKTHF